MSNTQQTPDQIISPAMTSRKRIYAGTEINDIRLLPMRSIFRLRKHGVSRQYAVGKPIFLLICLSTFRAALGWNTPRPTFSICGEMYHVKKPYSNAMAIGHSSARIRALSTRGLSQIWLSKQSNQPTSLETQQLESQFPPVIEELNIQMNLLSQCLRDGNMNNGHFVDGRDDPLLTRPFEILQNMMFIYSSWQTGDDHFIVTNKATYSDKTNGSASRRSSKSSLKTKASAIIEKALRLVTQEAFSTPFQLSRINLGMEVLQLQLHPSRFGVNPTKIGHSVNGDNSRSGNHNRVASAEKIINFVPLEPPYNTIPRGTWVRALRALTSSNINSSRSASSQRSVKSLVPDDELKWISPSDAAFRILQRLVVGTGVRKNNNRGRKPVHRSRTNTNQQTANGGNTQQLLDERDFNMVLNAYAVLTQNQMHAAHRVMALQERTPHAPPLSPVAYSILLKAYGRWKDTKNVEMSVIHAQRNGVVPDIIMVNSLLDAYINCGLVDKAREVFYSMTSSSKTPDTSQQIEGGNPWPILRPNTRTFNTLLKGMAEEGDIFGALDLSKEVKSKGLWDEITTNTLVKAAVMAQEFDIAEDILHNHTVSAASNQDGRHYQNKRGDHPNVEAYTELLDGYAKSDQLDKSLQVMQLMQKRGVTPNEYTYTCMVGALARNNKIRQARKMIDYAAKLALSPSRGRKIVLTPTYNAFISGMFTEKSSDDIESTGQSSHAANVLEALNVMQEMQNLNIDPNVVTVALLIDGLGRCNPSRCNEAKDMVQHLELTTREKRTRYNGGVDQSSDNRISLSNTKIATAMIRAYGRANDMDSAMESFQRIPVPDIVALNALLDACCRCGQLKVALEMFGKHVSFDKWKNQEAMNNLGKSVTTVNEVIILKPDVVTYTTLISALLQLGSKAATKRASRLYTKMKETWWITPDTILVDA